MNKTMKNSVQFALFILTFCFTSVLSGQDFGNKKSMDDRAETAIKKLDSKLQLDTNQESQGKTFFMDAFTPVEGGTYDTPAERNAAVYSAKQQFVNNLEGILNSQQKTVFASIKVKLMEG